MHGFKCRKGSIIGMVSENAYVPLSRTAGDVQQERRSLAPSLVAVAVGLTLVCSMLVGAFFSAPARLGVRSPTQMVVKDIAGGPGAPLGKQVVVGMDNNINGHVAWNDWDNWYDEMEPFWTKDMIYDFNYVGEWGFGKSHGLRAWFNSEHMHFNGALPDCQWMDFIRAATDETCTSASYGLARWTGNFAGVPPPMDKPWVRVRDLDFYLLEGDRIKINWCIIDVADLFQQVGYAVLPPAPMSTEGYKAPNAMDGFPAPMSAAVNPADTVRSEKVWKSALHEDFELASDDARWWADDVTWYGPSGVGTAKSRNDYIQHFLKPLHSGITGMIMATDLVVCEGKYCGAHFYLYGNHTGTWLGEQATYNQVPIRCGAHARIENDQIVEGWLIIDHPWLFHGMGVDFYDRAKRIALNEALA